MVQSEDQSVTDQNDRPHNQRLRFNGVNREKRDSTGKWRKTILEKWIFEFQQSINSLNSSVRSANEELTERPDLIAEV
jgi:hypothetical protein